MIVSFYVCADVSGLCDILRLHAFVERECRRRLIDVNYYRDSILFYWRGYRLHVELSITAALTLSQRSEQLVGPCLVYLG